MNYRELFRTKSLMAANRRLSRPEFEKARLGRFREFTAYVMKNSPYYGRIMKEYGIDPATCTPEQFPELTKTDAIERFDEIVTARDLTHAGVSKFVRESSDPGDLYLGRYHVVHTSGSSGQVGIYVYDEHAWSHAIAQVADTPSIGFMPRRRRVAFAGAIGGHYAGVSMASAVRFAPFNLIYKGAYFDINDPIGKTVASMNAFQPDIIISYGTMLGELSRKQLDGSLKIHPKQINSSAEPMPPATRELIERAFGPCLRNVYSCCEHLMMGVREAGAESMRLLEDELIFEIFDGYVLITNLFNRAMPLIRYRVNDALLPVTTDDHKPYRSVAEVVGRVEQVARFVNEHGVVDGLSPHMIVELLIPHSRRHQLQLTGKSECELAVVLEDGSGPVEEQEAIRVASARLKEILAQKEMANVTFRVVRVNELAIDQKTRKFRLMHDRRATVL